MQRIEFNYVYRDKDNEEKMITASRREENGLHDYDVCEIFLDFMLSVGFSEENVMNYFRK